MILSQAQLHKQKRFFYNRLAIERCMIETGFNIIGHKHVLVRRKVPYPLEDQDRFQFRGRPRVVAEDSMGKISNGVTRCGI
jgi:hypothetical protein